jgi:hypothetical protein
VAYTANQIAGTLKGTKLATGEKYSGDVAILTAIALAQQDSGELVQAGWWGTRYGDLPLAATALLTLHQQPSSYASTGDPPYQTQAFKSGAYLKHMAAAGAAAASAAPVDNSKNPSQDSPVGRAAEEAGNTLGSALDFLSWFTSPHNWLRVVYGVAGIGLVFLGLGMMFRPQVAEVARTVAMVTPKLPVV